MNRLQPIIDLSCGEQKVLQRVLAEPRIIADVLAPDDARETSRTIGVLDELAAAFVEDSSRWLKTCPTRSWSRG
ncbi:MAG: hypothetical protein LPK18_00760 [Pseudomonadaceae bacterium]|nr:hypothetical protein [Pseudomonadaceae bacterium]